jgi:hypothetical protein
VTHTTKYNVGQILYLIKSSSTQIIPVQVVEEIYSKTLDGEKRDYKIIPKPSVDPFLLTDLGDVMVFDSLDGVRDMMIVNATQAIDKMILNAKSSSKVFNPPTEEKREESHLEIDKKKSVRKSKSKTQTKKETTSSKEE